MPSTTEQHYYREFAYSGSNGWHYRLSFEKFDQPIDQCDRFRRLKIEVSRDHKQSWDALPLALGLVSRMKLWLGASPEWPPEIVVALGANESTVWFDYEDDIDELPWLGGPSRWRASFNMSRGRWTLKRLVILRKGARQSARPTTTR